MATKTKPKNVSEIYIRISIGTGTKKDTIQTAVKTKEEVIKFLTKHI